MLFLENRTSKPNKSFPDNIWPQKTLEWYICKPRLSRNWNEFPKVQFKNAPIQKLLFFPKSNKSTDFTHHFPIFRNLKLKGYICLCCNNPKVSVSLFYSQLLLSRSCRSIWRRSTNSKPRNLILSLKSDHFWSNKFQYLEAESSLSLALSNKTNQTSMPSLSPGVVDSWKRMTQLNICNVLKILH